MQQDHGYQEGIGYQQPQDSGRKLNHASTLRRIGAYVIDSILLSILVGLIVLVVFFTGLLTLPDLADPGADITAIYFSGFYLFWFFLHVFITLGYFTYLESRSGGGATLAKRLLSIQVVDKHGRNVATSKSFIRNIARWLWSLPCIGFIILIIDVVLVATKNQRIGDKLAKTYVVKEEDGSIYKQTWYPMSQQPQQQQPQQQQPPQQQPPQQQPPQQQPPQQQPPQQRYPPTPPPREEEKPCPDCGEPMKYIDASQQWYCYTCGKYK